MENKVSSKEKLKELIVYISTKCTNDFRYNKTKLNKILYYSDFLFYLVNQKPITGHTYVHAPRGPIPDSIEGLLKEMERKDVFMAVSKAGPYDEFRPVAMRTPKLEMFTAKEISFVDSIIEELSTSHRITATEVSEATHKKMGWLVTKNGDEIPYETIFVKDKKYQVATDWERKRAKELAQTLAAGNEYTAPQT